MSSPSRRLRAVLPVTLLAAGVALGSVSAAGAATLSTRVVKKLATKAATKVVKKQAPHLSVAHASSAGAVTAWSYTLPVVAGGSSSRTWTFPGLPAGTYLATYDVTVSELSGASLTCGFAGANLVHTHTLAGGNFAQVTGTGVITTDASTGLYCSGAGTSFSLASQPATVTFVPVAATATAAAGG